MLPLSKRSGASTHTVIDASMFQRLMAIPQEEYMQLSAVQQARQPVTQQFYNLEKKYQEGERILEPYKRLITQSETLDEMKVLKEKMRQGIMLSTPKPYQTRAKTLFQNLEPHVKINARGEIYDEHGDVIPHSHLDELIQYAVRDRRRKIVPVAWDRFKTLLHEHNVPKFVMNHDTISELEQSPSHTVPVVKTRKGLPTKSSKQVTVKRLIKQSPLKSRIAKEKAADEIFKLRKKKMKKVKEEPNIYFK